MTCIVMESEVLGTPLEYFEISSFIRGIHAYALYWETHTTVGQVFQLQKKTENDHDVHVVAIMVANNCTVGHSHYNLAPISSSFLVGDVNKGSEETTGVRINHGVDTASIYRLYGAKTYFIFIFMKFAKWQVKPTSTKC